MTTRLTNEALLTQRLPICCWFIVLVAVCVVISITFGDFLLAIDMPTTAIFAILAVCLTVPFGFLLASERLAFHEIRLTVEEWGVRCGYPKGPERIVRWEDISKIQFCRDDCENLVSITLFTAMSEKLLLHGFARLDDVALELQALASSATTETRVAAMPSGWQMILTACAIPTIFLLVFAASWMALIGMINPSVS